ncbi:MAG: calcium/sodium antiporter [Acidobacteriota bacterium]
MSYLLIAVGIVLLYLGGEWLVEGAVRLARQLGLTPLVIGATVVAFATSAPELAATITAALQGSSALALGNAFGSNIANLGLILGLTALLAPVVAQRHFLRRELLFMMLATVIVYPLIFGSVFTLQIGLGVPGGVVLLALLVTFLVVVVRDPESKDTWEADPVAPWPSWRIWLALLAGLAGLVIGARALVTGAVDIAASFGVSERVIGLSLVALGTSLPELATSLAAARKKQTDIVLGNVVGSNIFNLLCILGITAMVRPIAVESGAVLDYWIMLIISVVAASALVAGRRIGRGPGIVLLASYVGYMVWLFV